jgi:SAM-dependent methyltransferase
VIATDVAAYYVTQRPDGSALDNLAGIERRRLDAIRSRVATLSESLISPLSRNDDLAFVEDDICASNLADGAFDVICSFEVLEHLRDPYAAFREMHRLLKPGGLGVHEYNPFYSLTGGHSLCTLDFPWGHARLSSGDFERYISLVRPEESQQAIRFYHYNLNRMSLADLLNAADQAGLHTLGVFPTINDTHLSLASSTCISDCQSNNTTVHAIDLASPLVRVVHQKPANG